MTVEQEGLGSIRNGRKFNNSTIDEEVTILEHTKPRDYYTAGYDTSALTWTI